MNHEQDLYHTSAVLVARRVKRLKVKHLYCSTAGYGDRIQLKWPKLYRIKSVLALVERKGDQIRGEFIRCEVSIEPKDVKYIEKTNFEIDKCWVLPCT